jgi:hypothetical protein
MPAISGGGEVVTGLIRPCYSIRNTYTGDNSRGIISVTYVTGCSRSLYGADRAPSK